jgi:hypothetical protein
VSGDWSDIPWGLRLKIQGLNLVLYIAGVGIRFFFFALVLLGVSGLQYHRWIQGAICLVMGLGFIWADSQSAADPKDWLKAKSHVLE